MKIHEFQAKQLFQKYGVPIPRGKAAFSVDEAKTVAAELGVFPVVVKAQIHAGGRGKGGGVKLAKNAAEVDQYASSILGMTLVTHQTGPEGRLVKKLLVEEGLPIEKELYLSVLPDRGTSKIVFMASEAGGMDIEEVAAKTPEKLIKVYIDPLVGMKGYQALELAYGLNLTGDLVKQFTGMAMKLYKLCADYDCSLVEINPLILTKDGKVIALDGKINFDDNAMYRHKDIQEYRDLDEEDPFEVEASKYELNYIKMPGGNIGNMVNGAGLAMATMDIIQQAGAAPANFLDVGGGASAEQVENGLRIILADPVVKGVLINIFGGILRCDRLANGVVEAAKKVGIKIPVVIRMEGTNVEEGRKILAESGLNLITAKDVSDAAQKIAAVAKG
ncbi:MAG: ADP-forming succinate--CoA ligase subunit beta [Syntrophobacteraceae bacterium]